MAKDFVEGLEEIDHRVARDGYEALPQVERDLYDVNRFHFECVCGGLGVFFTNSSGMHWRQTIDALGRVGAVRAQTVLRRACALFPGGHPPADHVALEQLADTEAMQDQFHLLGRELDDREMWNAMDAYWTLHSSSL